MIFLGLPEDKTPLTGLSHEQEELYAAFLESAKGMQRIRPHHWANKNFNKARVMNLDTYYCGSICIMNDGWNKLL